MDYVRPFTYFVGATGGGANLLRCGVCNLIPVAGQVALLGYRAEVAEELVRDPALRRHPRFAFDRFGRYLLRGLGPFLLQLPVVLLAAGVFVGGAVAARRVLMTAEPRDPELFIAAVTLGWLAATLLFLVAAALLLWPMELHAQLSGRLAPLAAAGFAARFQGRVWGQMVLSLVAFVLVGGVLNLLGLLVAGIGLYLTVVVQFMAQQHLMTQLYRLYLDDGGHPIPTADDDLSGEAHP